MSPSKISALTVPINGKMIEIAKKLSQGQGNHKKAREVYLNTLAVLAGDFYCQCMEIETELEKSSSWDSVTSSLMNTAGLFIKDKGLLECRPVTPRDTFCHIPPEVWSNRIGYLVVEIDEANNQARLLGFVQSVDKEELPLSELNSLQEFLIYLHNLQTEEIPDVKTDFVELTAAKVSKGLLQLSKWFEGLFDAGWQSELSVAAATRDISPVNITEKREVGGAKIIHLMHLSQSVVLILRQTQLSQDEIEILLRLYPADESIFLPDGVNMKLLDDKDNPIPHLEKQAKANNWLQLRFKGNIGDKFSLRISLGEDNFTEKFVI
ncbi:DUF1822 family protein [Tolypothrix campylonemoides VB511288]|nr:DUF1822 family protein [Tolypothrix campylonemoides VB511288]